MRWGLVSALRETSVVYAAIIGRVFLKETLSASDHILCRYRYGRGMSGLMIS